MSSINVQAKQGIAQIRKEPTDKSELVTQILLGEHCELLSKEVKWSKIKSLHDEYTGFVDNNQVADCSVNYISLQKNLICIKHTSSIKINERKIPIPFGVLISGDKKLKYKSKDFMIPDVKNLKILKKLIDIWLGTPYLWGGKSTWGTDCSGFVQTCYKVLNINLPRDAYQQAEVGESVLLEDSKKGDLAFFSNDKGKVVHVGIILKNKKKKVQIVHASGMVRKDILDNQGIWNEGLNTHTHQLHSIKRVL